MFLAVSLAAGAVAYGTPRFAGAAQITSAARISGFAHWQANAKKAQTQTAAYEFQKPIYHGQLFAGLPATVIIRSGDTLTQLAKKVYGTDACWAGFWRANQKIAPNPNSVPLGTRLRVPAHPQRYGCTPPAPPKPKPVAAVAVAAPQQPAQPAGSVGPGAGSVYSYAQLEALWVSAGGPGWAEAQAAQIAECESGGKTWAQNPSGATGLWQILGQVVPGDLFDPMVNAENAVAKFKASNDTFAQWVCQ